MNINAKKQTQPPKSVHRGCEIIVSFFLMTFAVLMQSPLSLLGNGYCYQDSSIFQYVAMVMSKGGMPYRDTFDHKGPLLYMINYAGRSLHPTKGIWILEWVFFLIFLFSLYKICRLLADHRTALFLIAAACASFYRYYEGGNLSEEYALPFIGISLFIFLDYFLNKKITTWRLLLCGFSFGCICLLRINMAVIWGVFALAVIVRDLYHKKKDWLRFAGLFLTGFLIIVLPFLIWLGINHTLKDFIHSYLLFNTQYVNDASRATLYTKCFSFAAFMANPFILLAVLCLMFLIFLNINRGFHILYLTALFLQILALILSGKHYGHYGMILLPLIVYPYSAFWDHIKKSEHKKIRQFFPVLLLLFMIFPWFTMLRTDITKTNAKLQHPISSSETEEIVSIIQENTSEDEPIMVIGNQNIWYLLSNRMAASKYSYQIPIATISDEILASYTKDMEEHPPKLVVAASGRKTLFPTKHLYKKIYSGAVKIYRLKEK